MQKPSSTEMSNVDLVRELEGIRGPKLPPAIIPLVFVILRGIAVIVKAVGRQWQRRVVDAHGPAGLVCQHGDLPEVGDLHDDGVVVLREGLLPRLSVDPQERVVRHAFVELETDSMGLPSRMLILDLDSKVNLWQCTKQPKW